MKVNEKLIKSLNQELEFILLQSPADKIDLQRVHIISSTLDKLGYDNNNYGYTENQFLSLVKSNAFKYDRSITDKYAIGKRFKSISTIIIIIVILITLAFDHMIYAIETYYVGIKVEEDSIKYLFPNQKTQKQPSIEVSEDILESTIPITYEELMFNNFSDLYLPKEMIDFPHQYQIQLYVDQNGYIIKISRNIENDKWMDIYILNTYLINIDLDNYKLLDINCSWEQSKFYYSTTKGITFGSFPIENNTYYILSNFDIEDIIKSSNSFKKLNYPYHSKKITYNELKNRNFSLYFPSIVFNNPNNFEYKLLLKDGSFNSLLCSSFDEIIQKHFNINITKIKTNLAITSSKIGEEVLINHNLPYEYVRIFYDEDSNITIIFFIINKSYFYSISSNLSPEEMVNIVREMKIL